MLYTPLNYTLSSMVGRRENVWKEERDVDISTKACGAVLRR